MTLEKIAEKFSAVARELREKRDQFTTGVKKKDANTIVHKADLYAEQQIIPILSQAFPNLPVLCEEAEHSQMQRHVPDIEPLPVSDKLKTCPSLLFRWTDWMARLYMLMVYWIWSASAPG